MIHTIYCGNMTKDNIGAPVIETPNRQMNIEMRKPVLSKKLLLIK